MAIIKKEITCQAGETKAVVNYFGLTAWKSGMEELRNLSLNQSEHLYFVKNISCPILSFHGA